MNFESFIHDMVVNMDESQLETVAQLTAFLAGTLEVKFQRIRIDSVQQGGQNGATRLYHINAVDCVTQYEIVATCERLPEAFVLPVLGQILSGFPFVVLGLHADYGSQYINYTVAKLREQARRGARWACYSLTASIGHRSRRDRRQ